MIERYRDVVVIYPEGVAGQIKETVDELIDKGEAPITGRLRTILVEKNADVYSFKLYSAH